MSRGHGTCVLPPRGWRRVPTGSGGGSGRTRRRAWQRGCLVWLLTGLPTALVCHRRRRVASAARPPPFPPRTARRVSCVSPALTPSWCPPLSYTHLTGLRHRPGRWPRAGGDGQQGDGPPQAALSIVFFALLPAPPLPPYLPPTGHLPVVCLSFPAPLSSPFATPPRPPSHPAPCAKME